MNESILYSQGKERLILVENVLPNDWYSTLLQQVNWRQNTIRVFGKNHLEPRLTAWYGPPYRYSSIQWDALPIPLFLQPLHRKVCEIAQRPFNAVLLNLYRDGNDSMGWHSDNEPEMETSCIASLSLGASRKMAFRHISTGEKLSITLSHNSLLLMEYFQDQWQHSIPKTKSALTPRINLTFRLIR